MGNGLLGPPLGAQVERRFCSMPNLVRIITLSLVLLLLFLAAALGAQSWLQQQHARLQTQAIAAKQRQLAAALELTRTQADLFSPDQLHLIGRIDRPQVFEPPRVLVWELVMGCIWIAVEAGPTEGGRRPTGVGAAVSWAA